MLACAPLILGYIIVVTATGSSQLPHIIHVLADDFGWSAVGYHRDEPTDDVQTPNIDKLVKEGIELDRFYVYKICSPSRCAVQSGRNPIHVNVQNVLPEVSNPKDRRAGYQGIPPNMTGMAVHLQRAGYRTHLVGKWDVGMATELHHPRNRGYDSWLGYWHHSNDYWQFTNDQCAGKPVRDLWSYNSSFDGPATWLQNGPSCSQSNQTVQGEVCVYEEKLLTDHVISTIESHDLSQPLFLFWASHLIHMPLQVPQSYEDKFSFIDNKYRRLNHAMGNYLDDEVGRVVASLKERDMWNNTLFIFHSDNGGEILFAGVCGGNNWPLTGGKFSNFEGGIRVNAFVAGGALPAAMRGTKYEGYITGWDWYATYAAIAGVDPTDHLAEESGLPPIDSVNQWPVLSGSNTTAPRTSITIGETSALRFNGDGKTLVGGLIKGDYKLLLGAPDRLYIVTQYVRTGPKWPNSTSHLVPLTHDRTCGRNPKKGCLFDIKKDPFERTSLAESYPLVFQAMLDEIDELQKSVFSPVRGSKDQRACEDVKDMYDGYWGPFIFNQSSPA